MSPTRGAIARRPTSRLHAAWLVCLISITAGCTAAIDPTPSAPELEPATTPSAEPEPASTRSAEPEPASMPPAPQQEPVSGPGPGPIFPECQAAAYDFVGRSTLAALGLQDHVPAQLPEPERAAMIWVTHDRLPHDFGAPGGPVLMTRMLCFSFGDGGGGSGWPVDEAWQPPDQ